MLRKTNKLKCTKTHNFLLSGFDDSSMDVNYYWYHYRLHVTIIFTLVIHIYSTPPLGQDMTQGQFFKRSLAGLNSEFSFS